MSPLKRWPIAASMLDYAREGREREGVEFDHRGNCNQLDVLFHSFSIPPFPFCSLLSFFFSDRVFSRICFLPPSKVFLDLRSSFSAPKLSASSQSIVYNFTVSISLFGIKEVK